MKKILTKFAVVALAVMMMSSAAVTVQAAQDWREAYAEYLYSRGLVGLDARHLGFALHDFDSDGIPELLIRLPAFGNYFDLEVHSFRNGSVNSIGGVTEVLSVASPHIDDVYPDPRLIITCSEGQTHYMVLENGEIQILGTWDIIRTGSHLFFHTITHENIATHLCGGAVNDNRHPLAQPATPAPTQPGAINVTINNIPVNFTGQVPTIVDGRTLVPVRGVFEGLGFEVSWNEQARQATLSRANDTIVITIDSAAFTANGTSRTLDVPAQIIGGSTMLPLRAVLESVGYGLAWDENTRTVIISTN